ncbi:F0F1 ATP synthase subunit beta, partial [Mycoplasmopsis synoviae]
MAIGQEIQVLNHSFQVPVVNLSKGHIYDILGNNLSSPEITNVTKVEMNSTIKNNTNYTKKHQLLVTGIKAIDFFVPIFEGDKIGIFGGAGVGKTVLMKEIIFNLSKQKENTSAIFI